MRLVFIPLKDPLESKDGTKKYLYKVLNNKYIETAYIPDKDRATICVSSQAGCKMGCIFCMTGKQGFQGNLSANEILNQFRSLPDFRKSYKYGLIWAWGNRSTILQRY